MRERRLAVFDCDGTLVDSQASIVACMSSAFAAAGHTPPEAEAVRRVVGLPLVVSVARLAPGLAAPVHERIAAHYKDAAHALHARGGSHEPLFPGIAELLDALDAAGVLLGIATGKGRRGLDLTLERHGLRHRFATLQTADTAPGKPDPAMLRQAAAETGVDPSAIAMIGDTSFDMLMARGAGTVAIGVAWGYHPAEELHRAGAHAVVERAADIASVWSRIERRHA